MTYEAHLDQIINRALLKQGMPEIWSEHPICPNYEKSSLGRVRRVKPGHGARPGYVLKPYGLGYVALSDAPKRYQVRVNE